MTKTFKNCAAQGDMLIRRVDKLPKGLTEAKSERKEYHILAHSETGHHHVIDRCSAQHLIDSTNIFISYLKVDSETEIKHLREHDTHESLMITPGIYEIRNQQEYTPQGLRRVQD